jgi:hypothetical protein
VRDAEPFHALFAWNADLGDGAAMTTVHDIVSFEVAAVGDLEQLAPLSRNALQVTFPLFDPAA